jgi:hypothetical protein
MKCFEMALLFPTNAGRRQVFLCAFLCVFYYRSTSSTKYYFAAAQTLI